MKPRITIITLGVDDLEKSLTFYRDGLGLPRLEVRARRSLRLQERPSGVAMLATLKIPTIICGKLPGIPNSCQNRPTNGHV